MQLKGRAAEELEYPKKHAEPDILMRNSGILEAITLNISLLNSKLEVQNKKTLWRYKIRKKNLILTHL